MTGNDWDFVSGRFPHQIIIDGHRSEGSTHMLWGSASSTLFPISISNVKWSGNPKADGSPWGAANSPYVIAFNGWVGPHTMRNVMLDSTNANPPRILTNGDLDVSGLTITLQSDPPEDYKAIEQLNPNWKPSNLPPTEVRGFGLIQRVLGTPWTYKRLTIE